MENECYSIKEVCKLLRVSKNTLTNWRKQGKIKSISLGGRVLIRKTEVERILQENEK